MGPVEGKSKLTKCIQTRSKLIPRLTVVWYSVKGNASLFLDLYQLPQVVS
jgi:hypothetical protein